jgi:hypothetical protein
LFGRGVLNLPLKVAGQKVRDGMKKRALPDRLRAKVSVVPGALCRAMFHPQAL